MAQLRFFLTQVFRCVGPVQSPIARNQKSGVHSHGVFKAKLKNKVPITPDFPLEKRCFQMVYQQLG